MPLEKRWFHAAGERHLGNQYSAAADSRWPNSGRVGTVDVARLRWHFNKPYYLFRPSQILRRLVSPFSRGLQPGGMSRIWLPWGLPLLVHPQEQIGRCIVRRGLFDLTVSESAFRLTDPGDLAVDVGANIGYMTSLLARAVGPTGRVVAFEPHPDIFRLLSSNVGSWAAERDVGTVELHQVALSARAGEAHLALPKAFRRNMGSAGLAGNGGPSADRLEPVHVQRMDDILRAERIGVLKVDVEGHELGVFQGAVSLLQEHRIRDIIFEDFGEPPTDAIRFLEGFGYTVFSLDQSLFGLVLGPAGAASALRSMDDPSYLATTDPERLQSRLRRPGWDVLRTGRRRARERGASSSHVLGRRQRPGQSVFSVVALLSGSHPVGV